MDKNKNQLLAAGRKKLQQFRQKKDVKGGPSHGNSSKKNNKPGQNEADGTVSTNAAVPIDTDAETGLKILVSDVSSMDASANYAPEVSVAPETPGTMSDPSSLAASPNPNDVGSGSGSGSGSGGASVAEVISSPIIGKEQSTRTDAFDSEAIRFSSIEVPIIHASEGDEIHATVPVEVGITSAPVVDVASGGDRVENLSGEDEDSLLSRDYIVVGNLSDTERAQDPDGLGRDQYNGDGKLEDVGEQRFSEAETIKTGEIETSSRSTQQSMEEEERSQVQLLDDIEHGAPESIDQGKEEEADEAEKGRNLDQSYQQSHFSVDIPGSEGISCEGPLETKTASSTESTISPSGLISSGAFEQLEEELFLANFTKDIFCLQMKEYPNLQREFVNEISVLNTSLAAVDHKNGSLTKDLVQLKNELQAVSTDRDAILNDLRGAEVETKELHGRVHELEIALEVSHQNLSSHSSQLDDYTSSLAALRIENERLTETLASLTDERNKHEEERKHIFHENEELSIELAECQNLIAGLREELSSTSGTLASIEDANRKLEEERESLARENQRLSDSLADSGSSVEALRVEKVNLHESLQLMMKELESTKEENEYFIHEGERLSSELLIVKEQFSSEKEERMRVENELGEKMSHLEQLTEENISLKGRVDSYFAKISEINMTETQEVPVPVEIGDQDKQLETSSGHLTVGPLIGSVGQEDSNLSSFDIVKGDFKEMEYILLKLEDAIEGMHSHSTSLSKSDSKAGAGISKLIQAFESKRQLGEEGEEPDSPTETQSTGDPYISSKKQMKNLQEKVKKLDLHVENAALLLVGEMHHRRTAEMTNKELEFRCEAMNEHVNSLEACNVELGVLYEVVKQSIVDAKSKNSRLETLYDDIKQEDVVIRAENNELGYKLREYQTRIGDLQNQLDNLKCVSEDAVSSLANQLESLQGDATEGAVVMQLEWNEKLNDLQERNNAAVDMLTNFYGRLRELDSSMSMEPSGLQIEGRGLHDPLDQSTYDMLLERLRSTLDGLRCKLSNSEQDLQELEGKCIGMDTIQKLVASVEAAVKLEGTNFDLNGHPLPLLESLIGFLVQKNIEADEHVCRFTESIEFKEMQLAELQEKLIQTSSSNLLYENEILILKESLTQASETLTAVRAELHEKTIELQQSEQRVSSIREKLSIAVAKGKGLVVQRDNLKQSLAETSNELEKCSKELQLKEAKLNEVETKLRTYSEAGERVEALESELSYIRNSAASIRESFLLKDSMLQRIEEMLEDLDLPEQFHAKDIIGKVDWLARSATGNSVPPTDGDQKGSVGGSYSDASYVMDTWRDDMQSNSSSGDDLRRKYDELQGKFYGLAEQNEMLEQSLMERNDLVQRWEELLDKIDVPVHVRPVEPEGKIEWLASAISVAHHDRISLEKKVDNLESQCGSLTSELEDSHRGVSDLEEEIKALMHERERLSKRLETLAQNHEELSDKAVHFELENEKLRSEISLLQKKLAEKAEDEESILRTEEEIIKLQNMVSDALVDPVTTEDFRAGNSSTEILEGLLKKLVEKYSAISQPRSLLDGEGDLTMKADANFPDLRAREKLDNEEEGVQALKKELENALHELAHVKEDRDEFMGKNQTLKGRIEALDRKMEELQGLLNLEEQKCGSVREKLNVAVRKGKSLVQQRDSLKQTIEETRNEVNQLKSKLNSMEKILIEYEQKIGELSPYPERVGALESEVTLLRNHLTEMEHYLQDKGHTMSLILSALADIDVGGEVNSSDPVEKLRKIEELCHELRVAASTFEQDSKKSRRAAELLSAELDEVQERNDNLQEEIVQANSEVARLSQEISAAEAAKHEAISQVEALSYRHFEERRNLFSKFMKYESDMELLRNVLGDLSSSLGDVLSQDTEVLKSVETAINSYLQSDEATEYGIKLALTSTPAGGFVSRNTKKENFPFLYPGSDSKMLEQLDDNSLTEVCSSIGNHLEDFFSEVGGLKEHLKNHLHHLHMRADSLSEVLSFVKREIISERASFGVLERDIKHMKSIQEPKDMEIVSLRKNIALLREACVSSLVEVENSISTVDRGIDMIGATTHSHGEFSYDEQTRFASSEEMVRGLVDRMISSVKDLTREKAGAIEGSQKELKDTIASLQKELQGKDIQKDRICMELVGQIKVAEAAASSYSSDLQSTNVLLHDLEKQVVVAHEERNLLAKRLQEMQDWQEASKELQEKLRSLTDVLASKDQEIEELMQALDVEEVQMDDLRKKIEELERLVQQKNLVVEELEVSRGKALKKLSITVNKFDELHHFSASLLAEIEKLQKQLQERDSDISFLRQEVTRCTNDALAASQFSSNRNSQELHELVTWFDREISRVALQESIHENTDQVKECKELLQKKILSVLSELQNWHAAAESKDVLLQVERNRVDDLKNKEQALKKSLRVKESQLNLLQGLEESGPASGLTSEIVEVEPVINKWAMSSTSTAPQVRSLRKPNNDQVAIAIDVDPGSNTRLEDEEDDKVHGFKSLATSRIVPKFTRRATDMVDGLWVSCDRALMRQPALRLGIMIYWAFLHALLASFIV